MDTRKLGPFNSSPVGLGCMNLSHAYGIAPDAKMAEHILLQALELGYSMLDTATLYGFGKNEILLGEILHEKRDQFILASKCGMFKNNAGRREINGHPDILKQNCEDSLKRLQTEVIDLYYLHRWDKKIPIEDSVGALSELVAEGKIRAIGLSEVSANTLQKAHTVHPITAVQSEYSLWTRNPEIAVLKACRKLGVTFVAFSPLGRAYLAGGLQDISKLEPNDLRRNMPRFKLENYAKNLELFVQVEQVAAREHCTPAQLALAWLLQQGDNIIPIPGTTQTEHLKENIQAVDIKLSKNSLQQLDKIINHSTVAGERHNAATQVEIDTEEFI